VADPAVAGSTSATDTDYGLEAMDTAFIGRSIAAADRHSQLQSDSQSASALSFTEMQTVRASALAEFISSMAGIKAASFNQISASTSDSILNYIVMGARLSNSPNPSIPSAAPYYPYGPSGGITSGGSGGGSGGGGGNSDMILQALQAVVVKLQAIAAKVGA
jgi:hypothetical protein